MLPSTQVTLHRATDVPSIILPFVRRALHRAESCLGSNPDMASSKAGSATTACFLDAHSAWIGVASEVHHREIKDAAEADLLPRYAREVLSRLGFQGASRGAGAHRQRALEISVPKLLAWAMKGDRAAESGHPPLSYRHFISYLWHFYAESLSAIANAPRGSGPHEDYHVRAIAGIGRSAARARNS